MARGEVVERGRASLVASQTAVASVSEALGEARRDVDRYLHLYEPSAARDAARRRNVEIAEAIYR